MQENFVRDEDKRTIGTIRYQRLRWTLRGGKKCLGSHSSGYCKRKMQGGLRNKF